MKDTRSTEIDLAIADLQRSFPFAEYTNGLAESYRAIAVTVCHFLSPGARILDFGSGPCDKTYVLRHLGFDCSAYDDLMDDWHRRGQNVQHICDFAAGAGIRLTVGSGERDLPYPDNTFDMVMLHDVVEHSHDSPRQLLNALLRTLKPEGLLFITVPNASNIRKRLLVMAGETNYPRYEAYYWGPGSWRGHVREYVGSDLVKLARFLALKTEVITTFHNRLKSLPAPLRLAFKAVTRLFPGWRDSLMLVARKPERWVPQTELPPDDLAKVMAKETPFRYRLMEEMKFELLSRADRTTS